jgi:Domain of unknown function (DUF1508)
MSPPAQSPPAPRWARLFSRLMAVWAGFVSFIKNLCHRKKESSPVASPEAPTTDPRPVPAVKRHVRIINVKPSSDGQFYYVVEAKNGQPVYTSETYKRQHDVIKAARKEHEGRGNFDYVLQYQHPKQGTVRETL